MAAQQHTRGALSVRGQAVASKPMVPYLGDYLASLGNLYHAEDNPGGVILLPMSENKQNYAPLQAKLGGTVTKAAGTAGYDSMRGTARFLAAAAGVLSDSICPGVALDPACLTAASGCSALFDHLAALLLSPGDAVLIPGPLYAAFQSDFGLKGGATVVPCPLDTHPAVLPGTAGPVLAPYRLTEAALEAGAAAAEAAGAPPRLLLLVHPGNPTGTALSPRELRAAVAWARARHMHVVVDEVYGAGCFYGASGQSTAPHAQRFHSAATLFSAAAAGGGRVPALGQDVHVMWGLSKDWGASGFRVGFLFSQNATLNAALGNVGAFSAVSNWTQEALAEVMEDRAWCMQYLAQNAALARDAFGDATAILGAAGVPVMPADGGLYAWIDLRRALPTVATSGDGEVDASGVPWAAEAALSRTLFQDHGVLLTPGRSCSASHAGFFRACLLWMPRAATAEGLRRIAAHYKAVAAPRGAAGTASAHAGSGAAFSTEAKL